MIVTKEASELTADSAPQMEVKPINHTAGPNGIDPHLVLFGPYPRTCATATHPSA